MKGEKATWSPGQEKECKEQSKRSARNNSHHIESIGVDGRRTPDGLLSLQENGCGAA